MMNKGRREKQCFFHGPFFPAHRTFLTTLCALLVLPAFLSPVLAATAPFDETVLAEVQALQELKEKQPDLYQQKISALRESIKKDVGIWRAQKPEVYQRFVQRSQERSEQHRDFLRRKHPDLYPVYQQRRAQREANHEARGFKPPLERPRQKPEPARQTFEDQKKLPNRTQNNLPRVSSQPQRPDVNGRRAERPRLNARNEPRMRNARIENRPGVLSKPQGAFLNAHEQPRHRPSNSQGLSKRNGHQDRPRPRDSRQRS